MLEWLSDCFRLDTGFISSSILADAFFVFLSILLVYKVVVPVVQSYRLGWLLCALCGTDGNKHWFYGHTKMVSHVIGACVYKKITALCKLRSKSTGYAIFFGGGWLHGPSVGVCIASYPSFHVNVYQS